jgi:hypothetical protein
VKARGDREEREGTKEDVKKKRVIGHLSLVIHGIAPRAQEAETAK